jgi:hypothetical protein
MLFVGYKLLTISNEALDNHFILNMLFVGLSEEQKQ